jgi:hypothetical protein
MSGIEDRTPGSQQHNRASDGSSIYANQGSGNQSISHNYNTTINARTRARTGWAILVLLVVDVVFAIYGQAAYTGQSGNSADLWRAGIFLFLMATTGTLIRRWFRSKL